MLWYKEWANSDAHPKIVAAGFWGATVFRALCRISAEFDLGGRIPASHASPEYLSHRLQLAADEDPSDPNATDATGVQRMQRGLVAAVASRLISRDGDFLLLEGWGDRQSVSGGSGKTSTERSRDLRDRKKAGATKCNGAPLHATDATLDKIREEKRRIEEKNSSAPPTPPAPVESASEKPQPAPKPKKPVDPRHAPTVALLCDVWQRAVGTTYAFQGPRDGAAVSRLLSYPDATEDELRRRFSTYLADPFNVRQASIAHFASKWSGCIPSAQGPRVGTILAESCHHKPLKDPNVAEPMFPEER